MIEERKIYVDASFKKKEKTFNISILDESNKKYQIWKLPYTFFSQEAEEIAIITAIYYVLKNNFLNTTIYSDNKSAIYKLNNYIFHKSLKLKWIPRKFNKEADYYSRKYTSLSINPYIYNIHQHLIPLIIK